MLGNPAGKYNHGCFWLDPMKEVPEDSASTTLLGIIGRDGWILWNEDNISWWLILFPLNQSDMLH